MSSGLESRASESKFLLPFQTGDRMSRAEFHALYLQTPAKFKAELIQREVFVASPVRYSHGRNDQLFSFVIATYESQTLGVDSSANMTVILDGDNEVQPDHLIWVKPESGGPSSLNDDDYLEGPPGLAIEISLSSLRIDLGQKLAAYKEARLLEYIVVDLVEDRFHWFDLLAELEREIPEDGILKSVQFPGFWIDTTAFFANDLSKLLATLEQGLASPEHAVFVQQLAAKKLIPPNAGH